MIVSNLRSWNVSLEWQEAVAIIQELADTVGRAGPAANVPDPEHIVIAEGGELVVLPGSAAPPHPVTQLACTLQALAEGTSAPPELCLLVSDNTGATPTHASVKDFSGALAIFERPGRRADIASVAARASEAEAHARMETELERLRTEARQAETPAQHDRQPPTHASRWRRSILLVSAAVLVLLVLGAFWLRGADAESATSFPLQTLVSRTGDQLADFVRSGMNAIISTGETLGSPEVSESASRAAGATPGSRTEPSAADAPGTAPSVGPPRELAPSSGAGRLVPLPLQYLPDALEVSASQPDSGPAKSGAIPVVYTAGDAEVVPAALLNPQLPSVPPRYLTVDQLGVLDMIISETGQVEHVKLISIANRYQERMIVAAAKAWRFRPALKDGQPVKSRIRVRVTL